MQRINLTTKKLAKDADIIATIGNFDGFHYGHLKLLHQLNAIAITHTKPWRMLITFDLLPHEYFADKSDVVRAPRIGLLRDKVDILKNSGLIDEVVILHFNRFMANLTPEDFVDKFLKGKLKVQSMLVGHDFHFGHMAKGNIHDLTNRGIITHEFAEIKHNQVRISSSLIRELSTEQNLEMIRMYLGRNIRYTSRIVRGNQLARKFGMPTINQNLNKIRPILWGVYVSYVYIDGVRYKGVTNIGKNPTVSAGKVYKIETHLLDVDLTLYGKIATVEILHYLRPELKFDDLDILFAQMYRDLDDARKFFAQIKE